MTMRLRPMRPIWTLALPLVLAGALAGCDLGNQNLGEDSSTGESSESESSTGEPAELVCAEFTTPEACNGAPATEEIECSWGVANLATRTGDVCEVTEIGFCRQVVIFGDTAAGCGQIEGCVEGDSLNPQYRLTPEGVVLIDECGGTHEAGFSGCPSGAASVDDPPECACACELAP